ncbi:MAG: restriction endonuclease subunit S [Candidatus Riflebacteria bacterium]|nr:restriction endonuclease subunit S [Candidatus Riflebacteria bacterium]
MKGAIMSFNWQIEKLINISNPKQWANLPISKLLPSGHSVYGANGIIGFYSEYNHEKPVIAITCRGATCGNVLITEPKSYITSNAMVLDDVDESKYYLKFLLYALKKRGFKDIISGTAQPQITRTGLEKIQIPLPPLDEQIRIASVLTRAEKLIAKRKETIKSLNKVLKSTFLEMFGDAKGTSTLLGSVIEVQNGQVHPKDAPYSEMYHVGGANIEPETGELINLQLAKFENLISGKYLFTSEHILYSKIRPYLNKVAVPDFTGICSADIYPIKPITSLINKQFLRFLLMTRQFLAYADNNSDRANIPKINRKALALFSFSLPTISLQAEFAAIAEKVEAIKSKYTQSLTELENLYGSLSQRAFKGELDLSKVPLANQVYGE